MENALQVHADLICELIRKEILDLQRQGMLKICGFKRKRFGQKEFEVQEVKNVTITNPVENVPIGKEIPFAGTAKVVWEEVLCNTDDNDQYKKRDILEENNDYKVSGYTTFNIVKSLYNCSIANNEIYIQQLIN